MASKYDIDDYIKRLASSGKVKSFYPAFIAKKLNLQIKDVVERLEKLVDSDVLELKFEIRCLDDLTILKTVEDYSSYLGKEIYCSRCDEYIEITLENIFPVYYFNNDYKEYVKKS